jgi:hypothetical protein
MDCRTGALATVEKLAAILSINLGATEHQEANYDG